MQEIVQKCLFHVNANDFYKMSMNAFHKIIFWNCSGEGFIEFVSLDEDLNLAVLQSNAHDSSVNS